MADKDFFETEFDFAEGMKESLREAIEYAKGDTTKARSTFRAIADKDYTPEDISRIRQDLNVTQRGLAVIMGVSPRTVEAWETGKSHPTGTANRLFYLIENDNGIVGRLVK